MMYSKPGPGIELDPTSARDFHQASALHEVLKTAPFEQLEDELRFSWASRPEALYGSLEGRLKKFIEPDARITMLDSDEIFWLKDLLEVARKRMRPRNVNQSINRGNFSGIPPDIVGQLIRRFERYTDEVSEEALTP